MLIIVQYNCCITCSWSSETSVMGVPVQSLCWGSCSKSLMYLARLLWRLSVPVRVHVSSSILQNIHTYTEKRVEYSYTISVLLQSSGVELLRLENGPLFLRYIRSGVPWLDTLDIPAIPIYESYRVHMITITADICHCDDIEHTHIILYHNVLECSTTLLFLTAIIASGPGCGKGAFPLSPAAAWSRGFGIQMISYRNVGGGWGWGGEGGYWPKAGNNLEDLVSSSEICFK